MQMLQNFIRVLLLLLLILSGTELGAHADQVKNAKDWIENPDVFTDENGENAETVETEGEEPAENAQVGLTAWDFIKMIFATIFVIALLYILLRFINKRSSGYKDSQVIQNLGGTSLGANRSVQMIKVGNKLLVVGVGENIQLLKEIEDEEEARQIINEYNHKMEQLMSPSDIVTKVMNKTKSWKKEEEQQENTAFPTVLKHQLEKISKERKKLYEEMEKKGPDER